MARCSSSEILMRCLFDDITVYSPHMFGRGYNIHGDFSLFKFQFIRSSGSEEEDCYQMSINQNEWQRYHTQIW